MQLMSLHSGSWTYALSPKFPLFDVLFQELADLHSRDEELPEKMLLWKNY